MSTELMARPGRLARRVWPVLKALSALRVRKVRPDLRVPLALLDPQVLPDSPEHRGRRVRKVPQDRMDRTA